MKRIAIMGSAIIALATGAAACDAAVGGRLRNLPPSFDHASVGFTPLTSTVLASGDFLGMPSDLLVVGDYLAVADAAATTPLHLLRLEDGSRLASFGRAGSGPGEYRSPPGLVATPSPTDTAFFAHDANLSRLTRYDLRQPGPDRFRGLVAMQLKEQPLLYDMALRDDSTAVGLGLFDGGRVALVGLANGKTAFTGALRTRPGVPAHIAQQAYQGSVAVAGPAGRIAVAARRSGLIERFAADGTPLGTVDAPFPFEADYTAEVIDGRPRFMAGWNNRFGYVDVEADTRGIYALFSGRSEEAFRREAAEAEYLHLFDWEGRFFGAFKLDRAVTDIALDLAGRRILALTLSPQPEIVSYPLP